MEAIQRRQRQDGVTLATDRTMRHSSRPPPSSPTNGALFENLGTSSFAARPKPRYNPSSSSSQTNPRDLLRARSMESSDDEIDSLTGNHTSDEERTKVEVVASKQTEAGDKTVVNGMACHPDFPNFKKKFPDFKRIKPKPDAGSQSGESSTQANKTSLPNAAASNVLSSLTNNENGTVPKPPRPRPVLSNRPPDVPPSKGKTPAEFPMSLERSRADDTRSEKGREKKKQPPIKEKPAVKEKSVLKPKPFPLDDPTLPPNDISGDARTAKRAPRRPMQTRNTNSRRTPSPPSKPDPIIIIDSDEDEDTGNNTPRPKTAKTTKGRKRFLSPSCSPPRKSKIPAPRLDDSSDSDDLPGTTRPKQKGKGKACEAPKGPRDAFPTLSPLSSRADAFASPLRKHNKGFPTLSPLSSPVLSLSQSQHRPQSIKASKSLNALDEASDDEDEDEDARQRTAKRKRNNLRPFPMAASEFKSVGNGPAANAGGPSKLAAPNWDEDVLQLDDSVLDGLNGIGSLDPRTLCPFCDQPLPSNPTPHLQSLLNTAKRRAYPERRPGNPHGLKAPFETYIDVCPRHTFETEEIPKARARGWPTAIDFDRVRGRVEGLSGVLGRIVEGADGAREESAFWREVMGEVRKMGSRAVAGVKGQFDNFERTQPGYYGEKGSMILHQTLYNLFPPSSFDAERIAPLTPSTFIQLILVPEAALALIMQDTGQDVKQATRTMRESATYGVTMFPDGGDDAGEAIVRERAEVRRRELELEDRVEEKMWMEGEKGAGKEEGKGKKVRAGKKRTKDEGSTTDAGADSTGQKRAKRKKAMHTDTEEDDAPERVPPRPRPRPKPVSAREPAASEDSDASTHSDTRPRTHKIKPPSTRATTEESSDDIQILDHDPSKKARPRPKPVSRSVILPSNTGGDVHMGQDDKTPKASRRMTRSRSRSVRASSPEVSILPGPPASKSKPPPHARDKSVEILERPPAGTSTRWSRRMRDPLDSSSGVEEVVGPGESKADQGGDFSWLLSDESQDGGREVGL